MTGRETSPPRARSAGHDASRVRLQAAGAARASRGTTGFTLTELLVVIGIVALLISILLPSLARVRRRAMQTACLANMREIGHGLQMYLADSRSVLPNHISNYGATSVYDFADDGVYDRFPCTLGAVVPYLKDRRVLACPAIDPGIVHPWHGVGTTATSDTNYSGNAVLAGIKASRVKRSSEIIILQEWTARDRVFFYRPGRPFWNDPVLYWWRDDNTVSHTEDSSNCHDGGGNLLFVDGHAEWRDHKSLRAGDFGLTGGPKYTGSADDDYTKPYDLSYGSEF